MAQLIQVVVEVEQEIQEQVEMVELE